MTRWQRRADAADAAGDAAEADRCLARFTVAVEDVAERSSWQRFAPVPQPSASHADRFTSAYLAAAADEQLEADVRGLYNDPLALDAVLGELERRDEEYRRAQAAAETQLWAKWDEALSGARLQTASRATLDAYWVQLAEHPALQRKVEQEWDRRDVADAWAAPASGDAGAALTDEQIGELEWAYRNLTPAQYQAVERNLVSDPALRSRSYRTQKSVDAEIEQEYQEWQFERYLTAEDRCRGHMLNKRGQAAGVDPYSLMFGNAKRMAAYASDDFKAAIGSSGGHVSLARFKHTRSGPTSVYGAHNLETFDDVAHV